ncbi:ribosomal protein S18-alanine N-acetyltransferase [Actinomyces culturomici]|uniref:ribosomal protein S18-alanine N-acetyltransferase n=1 Tax=Actinomyces culturomici TaxID=1926276 RepID=UPI001F46A4B7|nr:ribosomal protein S18-alanine N-acetyltransferase [Actinomyces culturomici]
MTLSPAGIRLIPAGPGDAATLLALEETLFPEDPWTAAMIREELASAYSVYLLALEGDAAAPPGSGIDEAGAVCGYGGVRIVGEGADIMTIGVVPESRGRGLGAAILERLLDLAAARGASACFLEVRESNGPARRLYERAGFVEVGRIRRYFRRPTEDAIAMRAGLVDRCGTAPSDGSAKSANM